MPDLLAASERVLGSIDNDHALEDALIGLHRAVLQEQRSGRHD